MLSASAFCAQNRPQSTTLHSHNVVVTVPASAYVGSHESQETQTGSTGYRKTTHALVVPVPDNDTQRANSSSNPNLTNTAQLIDRNGKLGEFVSIQKSDVSYFLKKNTVIKKKQMHNNHP